MSAFIVKNRIEIMPPEKLPEPFADLESHIQWALPTETDRRRKRMSSSMTELQSFYDAIFPRMDDVIVYLNELSLDALPADAQRLLYLSFSLAEVSIAVEIIKQPIVPDGYDPERFIQVHEG